MLMCRQPSSVFSDGYAPLLEGCCRRLLRRHTMDWPRTSPVIAENGEDVQ